MQHETCGAQLNLWFLGKFRESSGPRLEARTIPGDLGSELPNHPGVQTLREATVSILRPVHWSLHSQRERLRQRGASPVSPQAAASSVFLIRSPGVNPPMFLKFPRRTPTSPCAPKAYCLQPVAFLTRRHLLAHFCSKPCKSPRPLALETSL